MSPHSLDTHVSISALLMAVVGGAGYILGPVLGTFLLNLLGKLLPAQEAQGLFYGAALVLILLIAPEGLLGWIHRLVERAKSSREREVEAKASPNPLPEPRPAVESSP